MNPKLRYFLLSYFWNIAVAMLFIYCGLANAKEHMGWYWGFMIAGFIALGIRDKQLGIRKAMFMVITPEQLDKMKSELAKKDSVKSGGSGPSGKTPPPNCS